MLRDIFEWDTENWSKALPFWESIPALNTSARLECLELGSNRGGLSLWLASKGYKVLCTDYENPELKLEKLYYKVFNNVDKKNLKPFIDLLQNIYGII
mgnify:CR=1 FL=1